MAQNKVVVGLVGLLAAYGTMFWFIWSLLGGWWINGMVAACTVYVFGIYHVRLIDDYYLRYVPFPYSHVASYRGEECLS